MRFETEIIPKQLARAADALNQWFLKVNGQKLLSGEAVSGYAAASIVDYNKFKIS